LVYDYPEGFLSFTLLSWCFRYPSQLPPPLIRAPRTSRYSPCQSPRTAPSLFPATPMSTSLAPDSFFRHDFPPLERAPGSSPQPRTFDPFVGIPSVPTVRLRLAGKTVPLPLFYQLKSKSSRPVPPPLHHPFLPRNHTSPPINAPFRRFRQGFSFAKYEES